jgi:alpha-D-ribose 1-methylphosphonate 5-triphosphate synthase subunit PhnH
MTETPNTISGGFIDYGRFSQTVFRWALEALARPALPVEADPRPFFQDPTPLDPLMAALALCLTDHNTPVWFSPGLAPFAGSWLSFHQGVNVVTEPQNALFLMICSCSELPPLESLKLGSERYPDRSATIILSDRPDPNGGLSLVASGPGLKEPTAFFNHCLTESFIAWWAQNNASYPRGADMFIARQTKLIGLPRSVKLSLA